MTPVLGLFGLEKVRLNKAPPSISRKPAAECHFQQGLAISQDIGEVRGVCWCQNGLGWAHLGAERLQQACGLFRRALAAVVAADGEKQSLGAEPDGDAYQGPSRWRQCAEKEDYTQ